VATKISPAKTSLDALLDSNAQWFDWIEAAGKFEGLLKDKIPWDQLDGTARGFVQSRLESTAPTRQVLLNSFYLTMVAGFEEYLRGKIREATETYSNSKKKYAEVAAPVRMTHVRESARLLRRIDSPPDYLTLNVDDLCRGLGSCIPGSERVLLNPDAFADVESLVLLETFAERVGIFGLNVTLDVLGKEAGIRDALKLSSRAGAREVSKALQTELGAMRRNRNRIAHTGGDAADVTTELLRSHRELVQAVATSINRIVS
jgi:hypothetical protein